MSEGLARDVRKSKIKAKLIAFMRVWKEKENK